MWRTLWALALVVGCAHASAPVRPGAGSPGQGHAEQGVATIVSAFPRRFTKGEVLYWRQCADCHGWTGRGDGPLVAVLERKPPNLRQSTIVINHSEGELLAWILHGKALAVPMSPAAVPYSEAEVTALLAYLKRLPTLAGHEVEAGETVYDSLCIACHGTYGRGDGRAAATLLRPLRDLSDPSYQSQVSDDALFHIISEGKGAMPGAADVLSSQELQAMSAFLRVLSPGYELYSRFCASCHGRDGHAPLSPPQDRFGFNLNFQHKLTFDHEYFRTHTDDQVQASIQYMRKQSRPVMPHFASELNADEASEILGYLRSLPPER